MFPIRAPAISDEFGHSVAISENNILAGAHKDDTGATNSGSVYLFDRATGTRLQTFGNPSPANDDNFGESVAISGNNALAGAYQDNTGAVRAGIAHLFDFSVCPTATPSPSPTFSPSPTPSRTPSPTRSPTPSPTPLPTGPTPSPTNSPSPSASPSPPPCGTPYPPPATPPPAYTPPAQPQTSIPIPAFTGQTRVVGPGHLYLNIQSAMNVSQPGDRIILDETFHYESLSTSANGLIIEAADGLNPVWRGYSPYTSSESPTPTLTLTGSASVVLKNIRLTGPEGWWDYHLTGADGGNGGHALQMTSGTTAIYLVNCIVTGGQGGGGDRADYCNLTSGSGGDGVGPVSSSSSGLIYADMSSSFQGGAAGSGRAPYMIGFPWDFCCTWASPPGSPSFSSYAPATWAEFLTPSPTPTPTHTVTPTETPSPTETETATETLSPTETETPTETPSPTETESPTPSPTPFDNSALTAHTIPGPAGTGYDYTFTITLQNTGNTVWTTADGFTLTETLDACGVFAPAGITLPGGADVPPGASAVFTGTLTAPASPQNCDLQFRMTHATVPFGSFAGMTVVVLDADNDASFPNDTIPATMSPNQGLWIGLTVRNRGNTQWNPAVHQLKVLDDPCVLLPGATIPLDTFINPNTSRQLLIYLTAPASTGPCSIQLQMEELAPGPVRSTSGPGLFGDVFNATIQIADPPNAARDWALYQ